MTRFLVTGANGFVGTALCQFLVHQGHGVHAAVRTIGNAPAICPTFEIGSLDGATSWTKALERVEVVIHLAARVHVLHDSLAQPLAAFRDANVQGTQNLARQAAAAGARRLVFASTAKVHGEASAAGRPFRESDPLKPRDAYAISKKEAEEVLFQVAAETGLEVVIIRPPLVYGPGAKANFAALQDAVRKGWYLPLGWIRNQRSLLGLDNLIDLIALCAVHPNATNQAFLASDGQDLSTAELVRAMARAAGVAQRLVPVPVWMLRLGGWALGRSEAVTRLTGNLQLNIGKAYELLGWSPPVSVEEGLLRAVAGANRC